MVYTKDNVNTVTLRSKNSSRTYRTGNVYLTNNCGDIKVVGQINDYYTDSKGHKSYVYFLVEFIDDSTQVCTHMTHIKRKGIQNPNKPRVYGVGYLGQGEYNAFQDKHTTKRYRAWNAMLRRCYSEEYKKLYPSYKDCTVDPRWHNFQNFCEDIQELEGYEEWKNNTEPRKYTLDKDIKQPNTITKVYSKDTCVFISEVSNIKEMLSRTAPSRDTGNRFQATNSVTGEIVNFGNKRKFCRDYHFNSKTLEQITDTNKIHKDWRVITTYTNPKYDKKKFFNKVYL